VERIAKRALEAFLSLTAGNSESGIALRALVLHMLEGYKPQAFRRWNLGSLMHESVQRLNEVSVMFPKELSADDALARVDAIYVLHERNLSHVLPQSFDFLNYLMHLDQKGFGVYAWVMNELMKNCGLTVPIDFHDRPFKSISRLHDLYWITHLYLLDTRYLQLPLRNPNASQWTMELLAAATWVIEEQRFDLAAEIGICLQLAGQNHSDAYRMVVSTLAREQQSDGSLQDLTLGVASAAHTTAACVLLFAGAEGEQSV
jgi:D-amino peptidase